MLCGIAAAGPAHATRMKILVTGGAGFIGSNLVRFLLSQRPDDHVVVLDLLTYAGNLENLAEVEENPRYSFVRGDVADRISIGRGLRRRRRCGDQLCRADARRPQHRRSRVLREDECPRHPRPSEGGTPLRAFSGSSRSRRTKSMEASVPTGLFREDSPLIRAARIRRPRRGRDLLALSYFKTTICPSS